MERLQQQKMLLFVNPGMLNTFLFLLEYQQLVEDGMLINVETDGCYVEGQFLGKEKNYGKWYFVLKAESGKGIPPSIIVPSMANRNFESQTRDTSAFD